MKEENRYFQNFYGSPLATAHGMTQQFHQANGQSKRHVAVVSNEKQKFEMSVIKPHAGSAERFVAADELPLQSGTGVVLKTHAEEMV
ncbi:hypothetical protein LBMAG52_11260 [Planctomycetia bacterium]|nr:hypothetical protein LBMAG52_11260 [Planctomycetia bacterium]